MSMVALRSLSSVFAQVQDRRARRGVRHPLPSLLALVFLGLLARIREMAVLQRWAEMHWQELQEPLGFTRDRRPHATTISRALASCTVAEFSKAFLGWLSRAAPLSGPLTAAVDAKTSCQGHDAEGRPVQMLTALIHGLKLSIGQGSVTGEKTNEPTALRNHLSELLQQFPLLRLITGDALYAQRPLAEALQEENCDYLVQIKANQGDILDVLKSCLGDAHQRKPAAETIEKKGPPSIGVGSGSIWTTRTTFAIPWRIPGRGLPCVLIGT